MTEGWKLIGKNDVKIWDEIVKNSHNGTIFHTWECLKIIEKYSKTKLCPVVVLKDDKPVGCVPFVYQKKLWVRLLFSPPHVALSRLGPLLINKNQNDKELDTEFKKGVDDFVSYINPDYLYLSSAPDNIHIFMIGKDIRLSQLTTMFSQRTI